MLNKLNSMNCILADRRISRLSAAARCLVYDVLRVAEGVLQLASPKDGFKFHLGKVIAASWQAYVVLRRELRHSSTP